MPNSYLNRYLEIARFILPLSLTSLIITLSHSVVNAGVARTADPEVALAAYALARSLVMLIENPMFMVRQTVVSLVKDIPSFVKVSRFVYYLSGAITLFLAILGFTRLGYWVLTNIMGASPQIAKQAHLSLAILFLLPLTTVCRNVYHGVAIIARRTVLVPYSTVLRLGVMSITIFSLAHFSNLPGAISASISFVGAFCVEALVMRFKARPLLKGKRFVAEQEAETLTYPTISRFFLPLVVTTFVATLFAPLVNTGLARSINPEIALAAFAVGHSLSLLVLGPVNMLHQCTLTFTRPGASDAYRRAKEFSAGFAIICTLILAGVSFSPMGSWILSNLMGVSWEIEIAALEVIRIMSLLPLLFGWREYIWGIMMQQKQTKIIGTAKAVNLVVVVSSLIVLLLIGRVNPAACGAWAMVFGELADCLTMQWSYRRSTVYRNSITVAN